MNKEEKEELLEALKVVKSVCEKNGSCYGCPLSINKDTKCYIFHKLPSDWLLIGKVESYWRAFYD